MNRVLFSIVILILSLSTLASAEVHVYKATGKFIGTDKDKKYSSITAQGTGKETIPGTDIINFKGDIVLVPKGKRIGIKGTFKVTLTTFSGANDGTFTFKDDKGKTRTAVLRAYYFPSVGTYTMLIDSSVLGKFGVTLDQQFNPKSLVGSYLFSDGTPAKLRFISDTKIAIEWKGRPGSGHDQLTGSMSLIMKGTVLKGTYKVDELSVHNKGSSEYRVESHPPIRLIGKLNGNQLDLTKQ